MGEIVKVRDLDLSESSDKSPEPLLDGTATSEHMSALLPFKFPTLGKYDAILDSFVTTTPTMYVRTAKALFDVIMHKVYCHWYVHTFPENEAFSDWFQLYSVIVLESSSETVVGGMTVVVETSVTTNSSQLGKHAIQ